MCDSNFTANEKLQIINQNKPIMIKESQ